MPGSIKLQQGAAATLQDNTSLALANNAAVACATTFDNSAALCYEAVAELVGGFTVAPAAGTVIELYLVAAPDGTNFGDADTATPYISPNAYVGNFVVVKGQTAAQRMLVYGVPLAARVYRAYLWNKTAQQLAAGWTLKLYPDLQQYT